MGMTMATELTIAKCSISDLEKRLTIARETITRLEDELQVERTVATARYGDLSMIGRLVGQDLIDDQVARRVAEEFGRMRGQLARVAEAAGCPGVEDVGEGVVRVFQSLHGTVRILTDRVLALERAAEVALAPLCRAMPTQEELAA